MLCAQGTGRTQRRATLGAVCLTVAFLAAGSAGHGETKTVTLRPGADVQAAVDAAPEGTRFLFRPGVYRRQFIVPKDRQQFVGMDGAVLSGAMPLERWRRDADTGLWVARGLPEPMRPHGECFQYDFCGYPEDLFIDGRPVRRVGSKTELHGPHAWHYADGAAYIDFDPKGRTIELLATPAAFTGRARDILLKNLVVEKYASLAQQGAIDGRDGAGWTVEDVTVRWNHGVGLYLGPRMKVLGGLVEHNGQLGIGGGSVGALVDGTEIAHNNYANFSWGWEAGGTKFAYATDLVVRNTCVHDNEGPGLWTDIDNRNTLYEGNTVFDNTGAGIKHEISFDAVIRNNTVARNGRGWDDWLWGSQILIQNSSNVDVYGNTVEVAANYGNAISMIYQDRGAGALGEWLTLKNRVHDNTIIFLGAGRAGGIAADHDGENYGRTHNNVFDSNHYVMPNPRGLYWSSRKGLGRWDQLHEVGMETHGTRKIEQRAPMKLSCKR